MGLSTTTLEARGRIPRRVGPAHAAAPGTDTGAATAATLIATVAATLLLVLATGCRTTNVDPAFTLREDGGNGVAVVSLTRAGGLSDSNLFLEFRGVGHEFASSLPVTDLFASSDWSCPWFREATDSEPCGRLAVVELTPGTYEFHSWTAGSYNATTGVSRTATPFEEFSKRFVIRAGEAVYLGNVHFSFRGGRYDMKVLDQQDRDLPLLRRKYPNLAAGRLRIEILE